MASPIIPSGMEALATKESKAVCGIEGTEVLPGLSTKTAPALALIDPAPRAPSRPNQIGRAHV